MSLIARTASNPRAWSWCSAIAIARLSATLAMGGFPSVGHVSQSANHPSRFALEEMLVHFHYMSIFITDRTSTMPPASKMGQPFANSAACVTSFASTSVYPPTISLLSAYGPSVIVFCLPFTTLPPGSSGFPWSLIWRFSARSYIQAIHFCISYDDECAASYSACTVLRTKIRTDPW